MRLWASAVCAATLAGCGGTEAGDAVVELGTGATEFRALAPDAELPLIAGIQGGYHFVVHARAQGVYPGDPQRLDSPDNPTTRFALFLDGGERIDIRATPYRLGYVAAGDGWAALPSGRLLQLDQDRVEAGLVPDLYGRRLRVRVEVEDVEGDRASDERWIVAVEGEPQGGP